MKRKILLITLVAIFILASTTMAFASSDSELNSYEITNKKELNQFVKEHEVEIPKGYKLESIKVDYIANPEFNTENFNEITNPSTRGILYSVTNSRKVSSDIYFPDLCLSSDWYDGPTIDEAYTYTEDVEAQVNGTFGASYNDISAEVGFSVTAAVSKSKTVTIQGVNANQRLNVKVYGIYDKYAYDVYSAITGNYRGTGYAYKPMGLYVYQATYSK